jgi:hypothetical protein
VVLGRDRDLAGLDVLDRLVAAPVAEFELEGRAAQGMGDHLVPEADAEDGIVRQQVGDRLVDVGQRGGIAGPVGEEDRVGPVLPDLFGRRSAGQDMHLEAVVHELAVDRALRAIVEGGDAELPLGVVSAPKEVPTGT